MKLLRILALLFAVVGGACGREPQPQPPPGARQAARPAPRDPDKNIVYIDPEMLRDLRITTAVVELHRGGDEVSLLGELAVDERTYAEVGVPIQARAVALLATAGQSVRVGQPLLELQSTELGRARADYLSAQARLQLAERSFQRKRELAADRIAPQREVQEAQAAAEEARAAQRSAAATLTALGVPLPSDTDGSPGDTSRFVLRSPIQGVVIERRVVRGAMLEPATAAFRIANLSTLWLTVHAFERDAVRIRERTAARVNFPALPGRDFRGAVSLVGRQVDSESRTVPIRIDVRNDAGLLRPGMSATAWLAVGGGGEPLVTVPTAALQRVRDDWCVFVPRDKSTFEIRRVGRGRDMGAEVEILRGVRPGETIVVDGSFLLKSEAEKAEAAHDDH